jgi:hypothetical protein
MMQLILIVLTKREETVAKDLYKRFYRSNETHPHHGLFTNIPI